MHRISSRGKRRSCKFASNLVQLAVSFLLLFYLYSLILSSQKFENVFPIGILTFARILNDSETRKTADRQTEREITSKRKDETINPCPFSLQFNVLSSFPSNESRRRTRRSNYYTNIFDRINWHDVPFFYRYMCALKIKSNAALKWKTKNTTDTSRLSTARCEKNAVPRPREPFWTHVNRTRERTTIPRWDPRRRRRWGPRSGNTGPPSRRSLCRTATFPQMSPRGALFRETLSDRQRGTTLSRYPRLSVSRKVWIREEDS